MKKILFIMVLVFSIFTTTETAFAYFEQENTPVLEADDRLYVLNPKLVSEGKYLVPEGAILGVNDTYYYTFTYEVIIEKGVELDSSISSITWNNSNLNDEELRSLFNFDFEIDHVKDVGISNGLLQETSDGELVEINVIVSMNDIALLHNYSTQLGDELTFSYLLTVSNK